MLSKELNISSLTGKSRPSSSPVVESSVSTETTFLTLKVFAFSVNSESSATSSTDASVESAFKIGKTLSTRSCFLPETFKPFSFKMYFSSATVYFSDTSSAVNALLPASTSPSRYPSSSFNVFSFLAMVSFP